MAPTDDSAVAAYGGYEYQLTVSAWVALELMIGRELCDSLEIEPASQEDVAANLEVPKEKADSKVTIPGSDGPIEIQIKRRSQIWAAADFRSLLENPKEPGQRGPAPRDRALVRLQADARLRYLLITDAEVHPVLKDLVVDAIGSYSAATTIPGLKKVEAETAQRIGVLEKRLAVLVEKDIDSLLELSARVPLQRTRECRHAILEVIRQRLLGRRGARLQRSELEELISRFGGFPPSVSDEFFPPANFASLAHHLEAPPFALILIGPPGIGKSSVAEKLVEMHRHAARPFQVMRDRKPYEIRAALREPGRTLFYLEDPWGRYQLGVDADLWMDELPRLIREAGENPDKHFLITSRTGLLVESIELTAEDERRAKLQHALEPYVARIQEADFDAPSRKEILRRWMRGAARWQRDWVEDRVTSIIGRLTVPQAISAFARNVKSLLQSSEADLERLLQESQVEAIGDVIARLVHALKAGRAAVPLWVFLSTGEPLTAELAQELSVWLEEEERLQLDIPSLITNMVSNGWLTWRGDALSAHPTVMDGLERSISKDAVGTNRVLRALLAVLIGHGHVEQVARLMLGLRGRHFPIPASVQAAINSHLREAVLAADDARFVAATDELGRLSTARDPLSLIVRALSSPGRGFGATLPSWQPPDWTGTERAAVMSNAEAERMVRRYVSFGLGEWKAWDGGERFVEFLWALGWDLSEDFTLAAIELLKHGDAHVEVALHGALMAPKPHYDRLLSVALAAYDEVSCWWEQEGRPKQSEAEEGKLDVGYSASLVDEPGERFYGPTEAVKLIVAARHGKEGYGWLVQYPRRSDLVEAWAKTVPRGAGDALHEELMALHESAEEWNRSYVWQAIGWAQCRALKDIVLEALSAGPLKQAVEVWGALFGLYNAAALPAVIAPTLNALPWPRRAAVVFAARKAEIPGQDNVYRDPEEHRAAVHGLLSPFERAAIDACIDAGMKDDEESSKSPLEPRTLEALAAISTSEDEMLAVAAGLVLARHGRPDPTTARRLLSSTDTKVRMHALRVMGATQPMDREAVRQLLEDRYFKCRRLAMSMLAKNATPDEQDAIMKMASDPSAPIRETCAQLIGSHRWKGGLEVLCALLSDQRDQSAGWLDEDALPNYHVARAAAQALARFEPPLPDTVRITVLDFVGRGSRASKDLVVHYELISVLAKECDPTVPALIQKLLRSTRRMGDEKQGTFPLRYAAAWGWVTHLLHHPEDAQLLPPSALAEAAGHTDARLAAPALITLGMLSLHAQLEVQHVLAGDAMTAERALLIEVGARLAEVPLPEGLLTQRLPDTHPGRRLLAWCWQGDAKADEWKSRVMADEEVQRWLEEICKSTPLNAALRRLLLKSPNGRLLEGVSDTDFRDNELPEGRRLLTLFHLAGFE